MEMSLDGGSWHHQINFEPSQSKQKQKTHMLFETKLPENQLHNCHN
jgi:hypothetical protein